MTAIRISLAVVLTLGVLFCCLAAQAAHEQMQAVKNLRKEASQPQNDIAKRSAKITEKIQQDSAAEEKFLTAFLQLAPKERINVWMRGKDVTGRGLMQTAMDDALVARGADAVPYLCEIVRHGDSYHRTYALKILCDLDRFVPLEDLPVPEVGDSIYVKPIKLGGRLDQFMMVDGRRIGKEGFEVVKWASEQTNDKDLRFHARQYSGLLQQDLRQLSLHEQLRQWRETVIKSKGALGADIDKYNLSYLFKAILIEQAPESIPMLIDLVESDSNGYVREEALTVLALVDTFRMRLRRTEIGRKAIEAIHKAVERGDLKPVHTTKEARDSLWRQLSDGIFNDRVPIHQSSEWSIIAMALEKFYGVKSTKRYYTVQQIIEATPEMQDFVSYLTKVDPYFPSWEYTYVGDARDEILHPRFKQKIARYYEQWKRFKAEQGTAAPK